MNKDIKKLASIYSNVLESINISNNMEQGTSTKFYPIQDMDEEEKYSDESDKIVKKLESAFTRIKSLMDSCSKNCTLITVSELSSLLENPEFKDDLNSLKLALQKKDVNTGSNSRLTPT